jgi:hypothetical protein
VNPIVMQIGGPKQGPFPLAGQEHLTDDQVSGVMFGARKEVIMQIFGDRAFYSIIAKLTPETLKSALSPSAESWYSFRSLVEYDRATHETLASQCPYVLELLGAASAELGMTRVYRKLNREKLAEFLDQVAPFHSHFQKFGRAEVEQRHGHAVVRYVDYPCWSPIFCASGIGYFLEAVMRHGGRDAEVTHPRCMSHGEVNCDYELTWSE